MRDFDAFFDTHGQPFPLPKWLRKLGQAIYRKYPGYLEPDWIITSEQILKEMELLQ